MDARIQYWLNNRRSKLILRNGYSRRKKLIKKCKYVFKNKITIDVLTVADSCANKKIDLVN
jgi:hypothetical protein